jgi:hypothetical protein
MVSQSPGFLDTRRIDADQVTAQTPKRRAVAARSNREIALRRRFSPHAGDYSGLLVLELRRGKPRWPDRRPARSLLHTERVAAAADQYFATTSDKVLPGFDA